MNPLLIALLSISRSRPAADQLNPSSCLYKFCIHNSLLEPGLQHPKKLGVLAILIFVEHEAASVIRVEQQSGFCCTLLIQRKQHL
jgi:hypothetical protein